MNCGLTVQIAQHKAHLIKNQTVKS